MRLKRWVLAFIAVIVLAALALPALWTLHNSRTYQLFGRLVPRVQTTRKVVALTFDDGPTATYGGQVLDTLRRQGAKATFFVNGRDVEQNPGLVRRMVEEGHEVGNHTYSHPRMVLKRPAFIREEVDRTDAALRAEGYTGAIHFRPPFGKKLVYLPYYLWKTGRTTVMWDIEPESTPGVAMEAAAMTRHVTDRVQPGSIILLHVMFEGREESRKAVSSIITELRGLGYEFVTVSELLALQGQ